MCGRRGVEGEAWARAARRQDEVVARTCGDRAAASNLRREQGGQRGEELLLELAHEVRLQVLDVVLERRAREGPAELGFEVAQLHKAVLLVVEALRLVDDDTAPRDRANGRVTAVCIAKPVVA